MAIQVVFNRKVTHDDSSFQDNTILRAEYEFFNKEHFHVVAKNFYLTHVTCLTTQEIAKFSDAYFYDTYDRPLIWRFGDDCIKFNSYYDYMSSFVMKEDLKEVPGNEEVIHLDEFPIQIKEPDDGDKNE
jgi:hypothetical protein